jgi:TPP-dependent indolepyruvate ferredoxin oxidoreductase alpha subunit
VVEELEPYLEEGLHAVAQGGLTLPIHGKGEGLFSRLGEDTRPWCRGLPII